MRNRWWAAPVLAGAAVVITACGSSAPSSAGGAAAAGTSTTPQANSSSAANTAQGSSVVSTRKTGLGTVLVNSKGRTLYWFAIDTPTKSNCNGSCVQFWPPVLGKVTAASGTTLPKGFGTITRSGGKLQATYDGHPLYTYVGDTSAGMTSGNAKNLSGGLWWAMTPSGSKLGAPGSSSSTSSGTGGGGYGY
jgi:predicted lipoprotein with Yx(FWY)xxD motif